MASEIKIFETDNIYQGSYITAVNELPPRYKDTFTGMVHLTYPATEAVLRAAQDFFNGASINVYLYSMILRKIRGEVMQRRRGLNGAREE